MLPIFFTAPVPRDESIPVTCYCTRKVFFSLLFQDYKSQTKDMQQVLHSKDILLSAKLQLNCSYGDYTETDIKL